MIFWHNTNKINKREIFICLYLFLTDVLDHEWEIIKGHLRLNL